MSPSTQLSKRQIYYGDDNGSGGWWYYSETAYIIKWVITGVVLVGLLAFFLGGYLHAQRRMKKGLPPLRYHRFLVPQKQRERFFPPQQGPYYHNAPYGHGRAVPLNTYGPPPPAYGENDYVPPYAPPEGASKVNPNQGFEQANFSGNGGQNVYSGPSQPPRAAGVYR